MSDPRFDVVGLGNAIVDVLTRTEDAFLADQGLDKGAMTLVDQERSRQIYDKVGPATECSGGSAANTIAVLAGLGGRAAFMGRVRDDELGRIFAHDIRAMGVRYETPPAADGPDTANCLVLVSPDAERTMLTYLGASVHFGPGDLEPEVIRDARVTYLEGYLWDPPAAKEAFRAAAREAHAAGREVALSLSDPFCVDRHRDDFLHLIEGEVDILFANEDEILSLYQVETFDAALQQVRGHCKVAALTRSEKGSVVVAGDEVHVIDAAAVDQVKDTTGAGDAYAAGFLYGHTQGHDLATCARIGGVCAARVISAMGARPDDDLRPAVEDVLRP